MGLSQDTSQDTFPIERLKDTSSSTGSLFSYRKEENTPVLMVLFIVEADGA
jgi:hypothetical protein